MGAIPVKPLGGPPPGPPGMLPPPPGVSLPQRTPGTGVSMPMPPGPPGTAPIGSFPSNAVPLSMPNIPPPSMQSGALMGVPPFGAPNGLHSQQPLTAPGVPPPWSGMPRSHGASPGLGMPGGIPPSSGIQGGPPPPPPGGFMPPPPPGMPPGPPPPGMPPPQQGPPQRGSVGQVSGSITGSSRIDPSQIPRPVAQPPSSEPQVFDTRIAGGHALPPPASSRFVVSSQRACPVLILLSCLDCTSFSVPSLVLASYVHSIYIYMNRHLHFPFDVFSHPTHELAGVHVERLTRISCSPSRATS